MLRVYDLHTDLIGKICKLTSFGVELEREYEQLFGIGNYNQAEMIYGYCHRGGKHEMSLMFIDEPPVRRNGVIWFCVKETGVGVSGDWLWYTLDQLMICSATQE